jgi:spore coat polysaccharide biosynthesis protein SpsF
MATVAIIQARMGSTRLPGKTMMEVCGHPLLWHMLERLRHSKLIDKIVIATTLNSNDDLIENKAKEWGYEVYRGSENDLLDRYYQAAKLYGADPVIRLTSDCPLIDPKIVDNVISEFKKGGYDLVKTDDTYPNGLDTYIYSFKALEKAWKEAKLPSEREHVGPYVINHPELFKVKSLSYPQNLSHMRWTIDEDKDYELIKFIFEHLFKKNEMFYTNDILALYRDHPEIANINSGIIRDEGYLKSLKKDRELQNAGIRSTSLSKLCLGTAQLGMLYGVNNSSGKPTTEQAKEIVRKAINSGIKAFDTAPVYGTSEHVLGIALDGRSKEEINFISKLPSINWGTDNSMIINKVDATLAKTLLELKVPYINYYLFHKFEDMLKNSSMLLEHLKLLKEKGLINKIGTSIYSPEEAEVSLNTDGIEAIQLPFNLIDKRLLENGFLKKAKAKGITILARSVFLQGLFFKQELPEDLVGYIPFQKKLNEICLAADANISELALRFALSIPEIDSVIIGIESIEQLDSNIKAYKKGPFSDKIVKMIREIGSGPEHLLNPSLWRK